MPSYRAPVDDTMFLLNDVLQFQRFNNLKGFADVTPDLVAQILSEAGKLCEEALAPLSQSGDATRFEFFDRDGHPFATDTFTTDDVERPRYKTRLERAYSRVRWQGGKLVIASRVNLDLQGFQSYDAYESWELSADGKTLYFSGDARGAYNVYGLDLGTGDVRRFTDVRTGIFFPGSLPGRPGTRLFSAFNKGAFQLFLTDDQGVPEERMTFVDLAPGEGAKPFAPEVVLCDIGLPGMNGYEVARAFRDDPTLRDIHLVAVSGYALPEDVRRAAEAGFELHLSKPPSLDRLEQALENIG